MSKVLEKIREKPSKRPLFKTSNFPNSYLSKDLLEKIKTVNAYYDFLHGAAEKHRKVMRSPSQIRKKNKRRIKFGFQDSPERHSNHAYHKNNSFSNLSRKNSVEHCKSRLSVVKRYKEANDNDLTRLIRISSASYKALR